MRRLRPRDEGGYGLDGVWNDDFHHGARVALTEHQEAYYCDYCGTPKSRLGREMELPVSRAALQVATETAASGYLRHPAARLVTYLENHDQVANSAPGLPSHALTSPARYRAMAALWLLRPRLPCFSRGKNWAPAVRPSISPPSSIPWRIAFARGDGKSFPHFRAPRSRNASRVLPIRCSDRFLASKLDDPGDYRENPTFRVPGSAHAPAGGSDLPGSAVRSVDGAVLGPEAFVLRYLGDGPDYRLLLVNLGRDLYPIPNSEPLLGPPPAMEWSMVWFSEHPRYEGSGIAPL